MPQVYFDFNDNSERVAIWKISENLKELEEFCRERFPIPVELNKWIVSRKLQWLSSRLLLNKLSPNTEFLFSEEKGPILTNKKIFVSVSHTNFFSCAIVSEQNQVGIDIEEINDKAKKIAKKFFHTTEFLFLKQEDTIELSFYTLLWTIKEAIFKKYHNMHLIFSEQIILKSIKNKDNYIIASVTLKTKETSFEISAKIYKIENHYLCIA